MRSSGLPYKTGGISRVRKAAEYVFQVKLKSRVAALIRRDQLRVRVEKVAVHRAHIRLRVRLRRRMVFEKGPKVVVVVGKKWRRPHRDRFRSNDRAHTQRCKGVSRRNV